MPEILEIEYYRRAAEAALDREIVDITADDTWFLKRGTTPEALRDALAGARFTHSRRLGKLLLLDADSGHVLGLRFGMTGRLLVDDAAAIDSLEYSSDRNDPQWDRFGLDFIGGGTLRLRDPRRLGGVELDPEVSRLGVDAWNLTSHQLEAALGRSTVALKARLMDQARIAGLGNLLTDEILWRAGLAPTRVAGELSDDEIDRLAATVRSTVGELEQRGGSHMGDLQEERQPDGRCPSDGQPVRRDQVGGRTTYWCPEHQR